MHNITTYNLLQKIFQSIRFDFFGDTFYSGYSLTLNFQPFVWGSQHKKGIFSKASSIGRACAVCCSRFSHLDSTKVIRSRMSCKEAGPTLVFSSTISFLRLEENKNQFWEGYIFLLLCYYTRIAMKERKKLKEEND